MEQNGPTYVFKKFNRLLSMPEQATVGTKALASHTFNIIGVHILITCHEVWINMAVLMCLFLKPFTVDANWQKGVAFTHISHKMC